MGYELLPHTADVMLSAWGPTSEDCLAEAARALVACVADVREARPSRLVGFTCDPAPEPELLVELLEEVIYLIDTQDVVPAAVGVARTAQGGLVGEFGVVPLAEVPVVGPAPKAVTRHGLRWERADRGYRCQVVVDV